MATSQKTFVNRMKNIFGIGTAKDSMRGTDNPAIAKKDPTGRAKGIPKSINLPSELEKLYQIWLSDVYEDSNSLKNRMNRYSALQFAWYNSSIFSMTVDLFADEVPQADKNTNVILVEAKQTKVKKYIEELFTKLKIDSEAVRDLAWEICLYGDSFRITPVEAGTGVQEFISIDVFSVVDRYEFNATEISKKVSKNKALRSYSVKNKKIQQMIDTLKDSSNNMAEYFKTYLFGFELKNNLVIPPWYMSHFRLNSNQSEFWPFGRSVMINSLGPFRQLQSAKNLMALTRASSFPTKHFEVAIDDSIDPVSSWEAVDEAREEYHNLSNSQAGTEEFVQNSEVWTASNQISFNQIDSRVDPDKIADVEYLRDELIMGTRVPKGYLIVDKASFGTSSQSLLRQHKPFARATYRIQTTILKVLTELVRLHFVATGDYDYDEPFELSMSFPMVEESSDRIRSKNDALRLAKDVIDNLGQAIGLGRDEALPPEVVKQIFSQLSFISAEDVEDWVDTSVEAINNTSEEVSNNKYYNGFTKGVNSITLNEEKFTDRINEELIKEVYFKVIKDNSITEGVRDKQHYMYSNRNSVGYNEKLVLDMFKQEVTQNKTLND